MEDFSVETTNRDNSLKSSRNDDETQQQSKNSQNFIAPGMSTQLSSSDNNEIDLRRNEGECQQFQSDDVSKDHDYSTR
jgi:hypothetical protein